MNGFKEWAVWTCLSFDWTAVLLGLIIGLLAGSAMVTVEIVDILESLDWSLICGSSSDL